MKVDAFKAHQLKFQKQLCILQDRVKLKSESKLRFIEAAEAAFRFGKGTLSIIQEDDGELTDFHQGLRSPITGKTYRNPSPALFSFNSPIGACPTCRGFGRIIETDYKLVIPDHTLSIKDGAIKAFNGRVYSECLRDLLRSAREFGVRTNIPWSELNDWEREFVIEGQEDFVEDTGDWYGVRTSLNGRRAEPIKCMFECSCPVSGHTLTAQTAWAHDFKRDAQLEMGGQNSSRSLQDSN